MLYDVFVSYFSTSAVCVAVIAETLATERRKLHFLQFYSSETETTASTTKKLTKKTQMMKNTHTRIHTTQTQGVIAFY